MAGKRYHRDPDLVEALNSIEDSVMEFCPDQAIKAIAVVAKAFAYALRGVQLKGKKTFNDWTESEIDDGSTDPCPAFSAGTPGNPN